MKRNTRRREDEDMPPRRRKKSTARGGGGFNALPPSPPRRLLPSKPPPNPMNVSSLRLRETKRQLRPLEFQSSVARYSIHRGFTIASEKQFTRIWNGGVTCLEIGASEKRFVLVGTVDGSVVMYDSMDGFGGGREEEEVGWWRQAEPWE